MSVVLGFLDVFSFFYTKPSFAAAATAGLRGWMDGCVLIHVCIDFTYKQSKCYGIIVQ